MDKTAYSGKLDDVCRQKASELDASLAGLCKEVDELERAHGDIVSLFVGAAGAGTVIGDLSLKASSNGTEANYVVDDPRFEVVGGTLKLKADVALDPLLDGDEVGVTVSATIEGGEHWSQSFVLILNELEAADVEHCIETAIIAADTDGAVVGRIGATDDEDPDLFEYEIDDDRFEIVGDTLKLKSGCRLDETVEPGFWITVSAVHADGSIVVMDIGLQVQRPSQPQEAAPIEIDLVEAEPITIAEEASVPEGEAATAHADEECKVVDISDQAIDQSEPVWTL